MPAGSRADYREISLTSARVRRRGPSKDHETGWFHQSAGAPSRQSIPRDPLPAKWPSFWQPLWRYIWRILRSFQVFVYHCFIRFSTTNLAVYLATSLAGLAVRQSSQRKGHGGTPALADMALCRYFSQDSHSRGEAAVKDDHWEPRERASPLTAARAKGSFADCPTVQS